MKLTKAQSKAHRQAMDLVHSDRALTWEERLFILENYVEAQGQLNTLAGAFFTPLGLARDACIYLDGGALGTIVDLCAGIGMLAFNCEHKRVPVTCVEQCAEYVTVGKRVAPFADWIEGDVFSVPLGHYTFAVSNPPFGAIQAPGYQGPYTGGKFEYRLIELASRHADYGVFILPQMSAPFRYSGERTYREEPSKDTIKFAEQTGIDLGPSSIDTSIYRQEWRGVAPMCEVVCCDFEESRSLAMNPLARKAVSVRAQTQLFDEDAPLPGGVAPKSRHKRRELKERVERKARAAL